MKYVKSTFLERDSKAHAILERSYSDVFGTFSTTSTTRHNYFVIFIDDFSRNFWIFFMRKKDEKFSNFIVFKALVEKETHKKVNAFRSNNGGEYITNDFKEFYAKEGT